MSRTGKTKVPVPNRPRDRNRNIVPLPLLPSDTPTNLPLPLHVTNLLVVRNTRMILPLLPQVRAMMMEEIGNDQHLKDTNLVLLGTSLHENVPSLYSPKVVKEKKKKNVPFRNVDNLLLPRPLELEKRNRVGTERMMNG